MTRPAINTCTTGDALKQWYWRKDELQAHARALGLKSTGAKFDVLERIAHFLDTKQRDLPATKPIKPTSAFDWHKAPLTPETVLTDSYRNTQNVRRFFKAHLGSSFTFSIAFMDWLKSNPGKTLADACDQWQSLQTQVRDPNYQTKIRPHNQFNQYTRDFLADNPSLGMADVRRIWSLKTQLPSPNGRHIYEPADLRLGSGLPRR